jgi:penicillin amidase
MIRRVWFVMLAICVLLVVAAVLAITHLRARSAASRLPERGSVSEVIVGCPARVQILIDGRGIPHLESDSETALWFGHGYVHARDRFFQMELARRAGAGRLAEVFGEIALQNDRKMRTLRLAATARRQSASLSMEERRVLEAYASGVNAALQRFGRWIAPEAWLLGLDPEPWRIEDSLTIGLLLQLDLSWAMGEELQRAIELARLGRERAVDLWGWTPSQARAWIPPGEGVKRPRRDHEPITPAMGGFGSNSWAVMAERSATGTPLLANDPHIGVQMPGTFFAIHLRGPRTHVAGVSIAGIPGVVIGHTEEVAWGLTLAMVDDQDLFVLVLDDAGNRELIDGRWSPLRTVAEDIVVRWQETPVLLKVRLSQHGPVVREQRGETLALSWAGHNGPGMASAILGMNRADSVTEAAGAWTGVVGPAMNLVVADSEGRILHQVVGRIPDRGRGAGRLPSPGSDSRWAWSGFRRVAAEARLDPSEGFLATANHDVFGEGDFPEKDRFPGESDRGPQTAEARARGTHGTERRDAESLGREHRCRIGVGHPLLGVHAGTREGRRRRRGEARRSRLEPSRARRSRAFASRRHRPDVVERCRKCRQPRESRDPRPGARRARSTGAATTVGRGPPGELPPSTRWIALHRQARR